MHSLFDWVLQPSGWIALLTLTAMEVVLGIDNVLFLSLISAKLPENRARIARLLGLGLAFAFRVACLAMLAWLIALTTPVFEIAGHSVSWRDIVLVAAGLFLIGQATTELHRAVEDTDEETAKSSSSTAFGIVILNIAAMDLVFSIDSILTAIGMAKDIMVMVIAILLALAAMYFAANAVATFIRAHPTAKVLALSFLVLIGFSLVAEGSHFEIPRGYLYAAMGFSTLVEALNSFARSRRRARRAASAEQATGSERPAMR